MAAVLHGLQAETDSVPALLAELTAKCSRLWPRLEAALAAAGQAALLHSHIAHQLRTHDRCGPRLQHCQ